MALRVPLASREERELDLLHFSDCTFLPIRARTRIFPAIPGDLTLNRASPIRHWHHPSNLQADIGCELFFQPLRLQAMNKIDMREVMTLVLGGGRGSRLYPLTGMRSKPAVPLAGKYRLIDIPISNAINSGLNRIYVLTQFHSVSLHRHIRQTYRFDPFNGGFVEILAAQQTSDPGTNWYEGTADAVRKNVRYLRQPGINYVLILSGDQLYRMDYRQMVKTHVDTNADVTIAGLPVTQAQARSFGIMRLDPSGRVEGFLEKPQQREELEHFTVTPDRLRSFGIEARDPRCVASMGIYLFNKQTLIDVLEKTTYTDFGKEIFPAAIRSRHVHVHLFDGYWEDIGTIRAFYDANLALASENPPFQFNDPKAPVYTRARFLPPARIGGAARHAAAPDAAPSATPDAKGE